MRPFIGWSATVVITLGRSRMGSSCPLLSSPTGNDPAFRSWRCSLAPMREVLARPSARLSQGACCLKKLFTCQGTPCRRGQTVTGSDTGRAFRLGSPSQHTTDRNLPFVEYAGEKNSSVLAAGAGCSSSGFQNFARRWSLQSSVAGRGCRSRQAAHSRVWGRHSPTRFRRDRMREMRNLAPR